MEPQVTADLETTLGAALGSNRHPTTKLILGEPFTTLLAEDLLPVMVLHQNFRFHRIFLVSQEVEPFLLQHELEYLSLRESTMVNLALSKIAAAPRVEFPEYRLRA